MVEVQAAGAHLGRYCMEKRKACQVSSSLSGGLSHRLSLSFGTRISRVGRMFEFSRSQRNLKREDNERRLIIYLIFLFDGFIVTKIGPNISNY